MERENMSVQERVLTSLYLEQLRQMKANETKNRRTRKDQKVIVC